MFKEIKPLTIEEIFEELNGKKVLIKVYENVESKACFMKDLETDKIYCVSLKLKGEVGQYEKTNSTCL
jgi:hypothetical protein